MRGLLGTFLPPKRQLGFHGDEHSQWKSNTVVGANILKDGTDPKIQANSEYPDWLWHLLDKRPALSELRRKNIETLFYEDLKRFVKLDNRARIKENNPVKAKS